MIRNYVIYYHNWKVSFRQAKIQLQFYEYE